MFCLFRKIRRNGEEEDDVGGCKVNKVYKVYKDYNGCWEIGRRYEILFTDHRKISRRGRRIILIGFSESGAGIFTPQRKFKDH